MPIHSSRTKSVDGHRPVILGEVLFDCFGEHKVLGGAPFNVAWNLRGLGLNPHFISAVGDDAEGERVKQAMKAWGMDVTGLQTTPQRPTGMVEVSLRDNEPHYRICEDVAYDSIEPSLADKPSLEAAIFYHGSLAFRTLHNQNTVSVLQAELSCPRFLDINLRPPFFDERWSERLLTNLDHLKLNFDELRTLCHDDMFASEASSIDSCRHGAKLLRERYGIRQFWITLGSEGAVWIGEDDAWCHAPATPVSKIIDTVGAGDAFASVVIEGIVLGRSPSEVLQRGNRLAARVCGIRGATTNDMHFYQQSQRDDRLRAEADAIEDRTP